MSLYSKVSELLATGALKVRTYEKKSRVLHRTNSESYGGESSGVVTEWTNWYIRRPEEDGEGRG